MMTPDLINGSFELVGGLCSWMNVRRYWQHRQVSGIYWPTSIFYASWGCWNLIYYPTLHQPWSFAGGVFLTLGTLTWLAMVIRDKLATARALGKYHLRQSV